MFTPGSKEKMPAFRENQREFVYLKMKLRSKSRKSCQTHIAQSTRFFLTSKIVAIALDLESRLVI